MVQNEKAAVRAAIIAAMPARTTSAPAPIAQVARLAETCAFCETSYVTHQDQTDPATEVGSRHPFRFLATRRLFRDLSNRARMRITR
jgi:hypothetical protein